MQIGIVDYGASNIFSVLRAISFLGAKAKIVANPEELKSIDKFAKEEDINLWSASSKN